MTQSRGRSRDSGMFVAWREGPAGVQQHALPVRCRLFYLTFTRTGFRLIPVVWRIPPVPMRFGNRVDA